MKEQILAVQRMQDYIERNRTGEIRLSDLARVSLFSPWYAYRLFRDCLGLTPTEYIRKYRFANAFHPFHGFSMMSCGHIAEMNTSAIYIVGAREPGIARGMGLKTRATFEEALEDAKKKIVGPNPNILALPRTFTTTAVHLCMKDPSQNSHSRDGIIHPCGGC